MASIFWDSQRVTMIDYLEQSRMINGAYYEGELRSPRQEIPRKRRGKLTSGVLLLQDHAPANMSQVVLTAATEWGFETLPYPLYSPDKTLSHLRGTQYGSNEGVIEAVNEYLGTFWRDNKARTEIGPVHCLEGI